MNALVLDRVAGALLFELLTLAVRTALIGSVAALGLVILRVTRPAARFNVWVVLLCASVAMPALAWVEPAVRIPAPAIARLGPLAAAGTLPFAVSARTRDTHAPNPPVAANPIEMPSSSVRSSWLPNFGGLAWATVWLGVYVAGFVFLLIKFSAGWWGALRLVRSAQPIDDATTLDRLNETTRSIGLSHRPRLLESSRVLVPATMSTVRPVVVFPATWRAWDESTRNLVLAHETVHVARRDVLIQQVSLLYRAAFWFSPFSWWLHHQLVTLAEHASDDAVLEMDVEQTDYAEALLAFFSAIQRDRGRRSWPVAMARGSDSEAERRVARVLSWTRDLSRPWTSRIAMALVILTAPLIALSAMAAPAPVQKPRRPSVESPAATTAPRVIAPEPSSPPSMAALVQQRHPRAVLPTAMPVPQRPADAATGLPWPRSIQEAEEEGARYPRSSESEPVNNLNGTAGTADRRCTEGSLPLRSGDFVAGPYPGFQVVDSGNLSALTTPHVWWSPLHLPQLDAKGWPNGGSMTLHIRAVRLDALTKPKTEDVKNLVMVFRSDDGRGTDLQGPLPTAVPNSQFRFWPTSWMPEEGRWLLIATEGPNWGCFLFGTPTLPPAQSPQ